MRHPARSIRIGLAVTLVAAAAWGCAAQPVRPADRSEKDAALARLERLAAEAPYCDGSGERQPGPEPVEPELRTMLEERRRIAATDHFPLLLEYGLHVHWKNLRYTGGPRELPVETNPILAELVRLAGIRSFRTPEEGGWLRSQAAGPIRHWAWSSYQIYVWAREHRERLVRFENYPRIARLLDLVESSDLDGVDGVGGRDADRPG